MWRAAVVILLILLLAGCSAPREGDNVAQAPLMALTYFWFGFDLTTGASQAGLRSSHWNTDLGIGSRVGVTDSPTYGYYASDDPIVIAAQLADMHRAGISVILASWMQKGDRDFDGVVDDEEMNAMRRAIIALMDYIEATNDPMTVALLIEPFMIDPPGMSSANKQMLLDDAWDTIYSAYPTHMFVYEGKPLIVSWGDVDLKEPGDVRFTIKRFSSTSATDWKSSTAQDWNWNPALADVKNNISDDGMVVVFPRFDTFWMHVMGDPSIPIESVRRVDERLEESLYEDVWQVAVDNRDDIKLLLLYSWNEHEEHAAIEPVVNTKFPSYGDTLVRKTGEYYRQFLAGQDIVALSD